ncbi:ribosomal protein L33 [Anoxybacillus flavithermus NBRC 109594]|uniref:Large ribosomal subunit protein bL33 n=2 Tax=Anoxybacillus TaxID=150247 RepID=R4F949_9BACL|nr:ribosomal protein L33 [Anoxybacillus flavithermus NBRC 109594]
MIPATIVDKEAFLYYDTKRNDSYFLFKESAYMRVKVVLQCTETGDRNYITTKNKRNNPERLELRKYCPRLKRHTLHRETK